MAEAPNPMEWADHPTKTSTGNNPVRRLPGRGSWTSQEQEMHINCLELLATELAMKSSFLKSYRGVTVLLQLYNSTAVAYINNLGGTVSHYPQFSPPWPDHFGCGPWTGT